MMTPEEQIALLLKKAEIHLMPPLIARLSNGWGLETARLLLFFPGLFSQAQRVVLLALLDRPEGWLPAAKEAQKPEELSPSVKTCPFCGDDSSIQRSGNEFFVGCGDCGATGPTMETRSGAAHQWHQKAADSGWSHSDDGED